MSFSQRTSEASTPQYGVKSYLHHFYDDCAGTDMCGPTGPQVFESNEARKQPRHSFICCVTCIISFVVAVCGITLFIVSLLKPDYKNDVSLNLSSDKFYEIRLAGAILFCVGGTSVSVCLSWIILNKLNQIKEELEREKFYSRLQNSFIPDPIEKTACNVETSQPLTSTPTGLPPALYEVTAIQPQLDVSSETNSDQRPVQPLPSTSSQ